MEDADDFKAAYDIAQRSDERGRLALERCGVCQNQHPAVRRLPYNVRLCAACQHWDDARHVFACQGSVFALSLHSLQMFAPSKTIQDLQQNTECVLCTTVLKGVQQRIPALQVTGRSPSHSLKIFNGGPYYFAGPEHVVPPNAKDYSSKDCVIRCVIWLAVHPDPESYVEMNRAVFRQGGTWLDNSFGLQVDLHYSSLGTGLFDVCIWEESYIPIDGLLRRLETCDKHHEHRFVPHDSAHHDSVTFRVIDVERLGVVEAPRGAKHVALSYVWKAAAPAQIDRLESSNVQALQQNGALTQNKLSGLIWDAMSLCRDLGERFLWVDRLCIVQDDADDSRAQIAAMDWIYSSASLTIVAAVSDVSSLGLPGVRGRPRKHSVFDHMRQLYTDNPAVRDNMRLAIDGSVWNTRGWTFQERILSQKIVLISDYASYFLCPQDAYQEDLGSVPSYLSESSTRHAESCSITPLGNIMDFSEFCDTVEQYTSRNLSFETDILNAFVGVTNVLTAQLDTETMYGLPESHLAEALLWGPATTNPMRRREGVPEIPSWSWAAWTGTLQYKTALGNFQSEHDPDAVGALVRFHSSQSGRLREVRSAERWFGMDMRTVVAGDTVAVNTIKGRAAYWPQDMTKMWQTCPHNPWTSRAHRSIDGSTVTTATRHPGALLFNTTVASLHLRLVAQYLDRAVIDVCDRQLRSVGRLMKMSHGYMQTWIDLNQIYDFIVICAAVLPPFERRGPTKDNDLWDTAVFGDGALDRHFPSRKVLSPWMLRVMMVERDLDNPVIRRRLAVGSIEVRCWQFCEPRWEPIILV